ncbi:MAG: FAD:protein FMN transferase [Planctomycetota bacterium]|nr:FAD:protein FMN transferase [Planctomycetota bacterium]
MTSKTFGHRATNIVVALATAMFLFACNKTVESPIVQVGGNTMGTTWVATLTPPTDNDRSHGGWLLLIQKALDEVDGAMSTYRADSDLNRFTGAQPGSPVPLSPHTQTVLVAARRVHRDSHGAFDPTIGGLLELWGFGVKRTNAGEAFSKEAPEPAAILAQLEASGLSKVQSLDGDATIFAENPSALYLDFSAIAKGYGVDRVAAVLRENHVENFLIEVGGEVVTGGQRPGGGPWRLAIESPLPDRPDLTARLQLTDRALATSGNYRNFRELGNGQVISHTIDPRTGRPVEDAPASVSVLAPTCMEADAWATALSVLGRQGLAIIEGMPQVEARMILMAKGREVERIRTTSGWPKTPVQSAE